MKAQVSYYLQRMMGLVSTQMVAGETAVPSSFYLSIKLIYQDPKRGFGVVGRSEERRVGKD